jgi:predicted PurR-regulated permease PerM
METLSFAFGVLTMVGVAFAALIIVSIVKAYKQQTRIQQLEEWLLNVDREMHHQDNEVYKAIDDRIRGVNDQITDAVTACNSYTDKRIDKLIDTYFMVKEAEKQTKKQLNG